MQIKDLFELSSLLVQDSNVGKVKGLLSLLLLFVVWHAVIIVIIAVIRNVFAVFFILCFRVNSISLKFTTNL
ncbi:MAG: hypothetical protein Kow0076_4470 [Francisella sp.]